MPFKYDMTWIAHAKRWRKRYRGRTYYLKTNVNGKSDRPGYLAALAEWERLKAFLDGLGPNPYTSTGALIPAGQLPSQLAGQLARQFAEAPAAFASAPPIGVERVAIPNDPPWILSRGIAAALHPSLLVRTEQPNPYAGERRVSELVTLYLDHRRQEAERGNLSLKMYDEDKRQVETFQNFTNVNFPTLVSIDQLTPAVLNIYRDQQTTLCGSNVTLKKRLEGVRKWLAWLIDRNILTEFPKDMTTYAKVRLDKPRPEFFTIQEMQEIYAKANPLLRACMLLGLNAGFTQRDCSTLTPKMIDWQTGILSRDRNKTGTEQRAKLWPETQAAIRAVMHKGEFVFRNTVGNPLIFESVQANGKVTTTDTIKKMFRCLHVDCEGKTFKHFRKTAANYIEQWNPSLTGVFLAHAERGVKRHYVNQHYEQLFQLTDRLRAELSPVWQSAVKIAS